MIKVRFVLNLRWELNIALSKDVGTPLLNVIFLGTSAGTIRELGNLQQALEAEMRYHQKEKSGIEGQKSASGRKK